MAEFYLLIVIYFLYFELLIFLLWQSSCLGVKFVYLDFALFYFGGPANPGSVHRITPERIGDHVGAWDRTQ